MNSYEVKTRKGYKVRSEVKTFIVKGYNLQMVREELYLKIDIDEVIVSVKRIWKAGVLEKQVRRERKPQLFEVLGHRVNIYKKGVEFVGYLLVDDVETMEITRKTRQQITHYYKDVIQNKL